MIVDPETNRARAEIYDDLTRRCAPLADRILWRIEAWLDYWLYELWSRYTEFCVRRGLIDGTDGLMRQTRTGEYEMSHCRTCGHHEGEHCAPVQGEGFVIRDAQGCSVPGCMCSYWRAVREYAYP